MNELETVLEGVSPEPESPGHETPGGAAPPSPEVPAAESSELPAVEGPAADASAAEAVVAEPVEAPASDQMSDIVARPKSVETSLDAADKSVCAPEPAAEPASAEIPVSMDELLATEEPAPAPAEDSQLRAVLEAIVYIAEEPLTLAQISAALQQPAERIRTLLEQLIADFDKSEHGVTIREVAGGYKMATKPEHHETVRNFVKSLKPPLKLSLPALETLAVIAYKQPVTAPEINEIRGVRGAGVLNTLLDRKLIAAAGRKNVIGKPILYKTTKEFLIQFGLKDLSELPTLKEFEEIRRMALSDTEPEPAGGASPAPQSGAPAEAASEANPEAPSEALPEPHKKPQES